MKGLTVLASVFALGTALSFTPNSDACTQPRDGAGEPGVEPGDPSGTPPEGGTPGEADPGNEGGADDPGAGIDPGASDPGAGGDPAAGGGTGEPDPGSEGTPPTFTPDPGSSTDENGAPIPPTAFLLIGWEPGYDVDSDPSAGYFRHSGHKIDTRVVITDRTTGLVVLDERVPQYDYENATKRDPGPTITQLATRLPAGRYEAKVQSVFYRHDEIRFGMDGRFRSIDKADLAPAIDPSVKGVSFIVNELAAEDSSSEMSGGCSATGTNSGGLTPSLALLALMALGLIRRRDGRR